MWSEHKPIPVLATNSRKVLRREFAHLVLIGSVWRSSSMGKTARKLHLTNDGPWLAWLRRDGTAWGFLSAAPLPQQCSDAACGAHEIGVHEAHLHADLAGSQGSMSRTYIAYYVSRRQTQLRS